MPLRRRRGAVLWLLELLSTLPELLLALVPGPAESPAARRRNRILLITFGVLLAFGAAFGIGYFLVSLLPHGKPS